MSSDKTQELGLQVTPKERLSHSAGATHEMAPTSEDTAVSKLMARAMIPKLRHLDWNGFHSSVGDESPFVIEVLLPFSVRGHSNSSESPEPNMGPGNHGCAGQMPLPERMRINSEHITQALNEIHGSRICPRNGPVLMFQPYKTLVFHNQAIRNKVASLMKDIEKSQDAGQEGSVITGEPETHTGDNGSVKSTCLSHLKCLIEFMDIVSAREAYLESPDFDTVYFSDIWLLFKPGDIIIGQDLRQAYRIIRVESKFDTAQMDDALHIKDGATIIHCVYIDFDGKRLGPVARKFVLRMFEFPRHKQSLDILPLSSALRMNDHLRQNLIERGGSFLQVAGGALKHYIGSPVGSDADIDSAVFVDFEQAFLSEEGSGWKPEFEAGLANATMAASRLIEYDGQTDCHYTNNNVHQDSYVDSERWHSFIQAQHESRDTPLQALPATIQPRLPHTSPNLAEEELMIVSHKVFAFVLRTGKWAHLDIECMMSVEDNEDITLEDLVIPSHIKDIAKALTVHHLEHNKSRTSIDRQYRKHFHQGEGLTLLSHGAPGVGRKTTAQCIANIARVPLLSLSARELLSMPWPPDWEKRLETCFLLTKRWGGIILIDQAEKFIERAEGYETYRSSLVQAFLRLLDSFSGVTFLISDSSTPDIDHNFLSRINATFYYPPLDQDQTLLIFSRNISLTEKQFSQKHQHEDVRLHISKKEVLFFARTFYDQSPPFRRWNCRQIRKAFSTALTLAHGDIEQPTPGEGYRITLGASHFEAVANMYQSFFNHSTSQLQLKDMPHSNNWKADFARSPEQFEGLAKAPVAPLDHSLPAQKEDFPQSIPSSPRAPMLATRSPPLMPQTTAASFVPPADPYFVLASPLSLEARPMLRVLEWEFFKESRAEKGGVCAAIDVLQGEPAVSFDLDAQANIWWSKWTVRNQEEKSKAKLESAQDYEQLGRLEAVSIPERIRIHSKQLAKILEEVFNAYISEQAFIMIRPFRALAHYEGRIRTRLTELVGKSKEQTPKQHHAPQLESEDTWEDISDSDSEASHSAGVDASSPTAVQHLECLVQLLDKIQTRTNYLFSGSCGKVFFTDVWYLFKPGDEVIDQKQRQVYRILSVNSSGHGVLPPWQAWNSDKRGLKKKEQRVAVTLLCVYVDFDGEMLGPVTSEFQIVRFEGEEDITSLPVYPLRLVKCAKAFASGNRNSGNRQWLVERGRMFVDVIRSRPMHHNGPLLDPKEEADSQVVVDFKEYFDCLGRTSVIRRPAVEQLVGKPIGKSDSQPPCKAGCCSGEHVYHDDFAEEERNEEYIATLVPDPQDRTTTSVAIYPRRLSEISSTGMDFSDEDLVIMSFRVYGYILRSRKWAQMDLRYFTSLDSGRPSQEGSTDQDRRFADLKPQENISTDAARGVYTIADTTLDQLVLPPGHKQIVVSLIDQHFKNKTLRRHAQEETDIVRGKGKGLILLLHGAPGVGKTTTAEGVAQYFNKPLFQITCGDLGTSAKELEGALEWHFYLANKWDCVLLLDEADVFLAERSPEDFKRNSLVAVFLRVLEYYAGVLFLTTNRIGDFDEAFSSRIHISLYYPPLKRRSTKQIFDLNLQLIRQRIEDRGVEIQIDRNQILDWAIEYWKRHKKMRWNGRQIRNACHTALALAEYDAQRVTRSESSGRGASFDKATQNPPKVRLTIDHFETVSKAYLEFIRYLHEIYGKDADRRAKAMGIRAREFSMKHWDAKEQLDKDGQDAEEDDESEEENAETEAAALGQRVSSTQKHHARAPDRVSRPESLSIPAHPSPSALGLTPTQAVPGAVPHLPFAPFAAPNMPQAAQTFPGPFGFQTPFGGPPQPQPASYSPATDQQRQYLANMAAWSTMISGGQQAPFPVMFGAQAQPQGSPQPPAAGAQPPPEWQPPGSSAPRSG